MSTKKSKSELLKMDRAVEENDSVAAGIRTRGYVISETPLVKQVYAYGKRIWLKASWVTTVGDGVLFIKHVAFRDHKDLPINRASFLAMRRRLIESRQVIL
jgi:hypothetical protein